jgi:hypothetical protein
VSTAKGRERRWRLFSTFPLWLSATVSTKGVDGEEGAKNLMGKLRNKKMKTDLIMPVISF